MDFFCCGLTSVLAFPLVLLTAMANARSIRFKQIFGYTSAGMTLLLGGLLSFVSFEINGPWIVFVMSTLVCVGITVHLTRLNLRYARYNPGLCSACGYDLRGSQTSSHCPECGELITDKIDTDTINKD